MKRLNKNKKRILVGVILITLVITLFLGLDTKIKVTKINLTSKKITNKIKIAYLSDMHSCNYGVDQKELLEPLIKAAPDVVFLGGDIIDDVLPMEQGFKTVKAIADKFDTYYVSGNHEFWSYKISYIKNELRALGVKVLEGDSITITINNNKVLLSGVDDPELGNPDYNEQLDKVKKQNENSENLNILLAHRPERVEEYSGLNVDYVLSGHAHGGQWRIPLLLNGLFSPDQGLFPKYTSGVYSISNAKLIVSKGLSRESTRVPRFFNNPEILIIEVNPE